MPWSRDRALLCASVLSPEAVLEPLSLSSEEGIAQSLLGELSCLWSAFSLFFKEEKVVLFPSGAQIPN